MKRVLWVVLPIVVLVLAGIAYLVWLRTDQPGPWSDLRYRRLTTDEQRRQGLSGTESLPADEAALFVFDESRPHCFWMKDMRYPIDMVWLDDSKRVVHIQASVPPESYPTEFCPPEPARYVIEVNAGKAGQDGVVVGSQLQF